ncbi:phenylalanine--tRNA ligase subunit beta [Methanobrevibacter filiformis]|uniref:Phenylalanine--tRNA ligase beta subunit n=1 Tax=Methanobrevibacter filiformis TaxID=55758 RepID=A0A165Z9L0_9EURY|nr:phenylalanine--tRNA ligase subunit beta [Methanobrevibacter filiformis]KZX10439.1 phenylalanine--tRNA ligase beta subunit [Methanobrevibacter filiformis]
MPVITFEYQDLKNLGIELEKDELIDILPMLGSDIEDFNDNEIKVEFFPNRPDQLSIEGVSRSLKGFLSKETGLPEYDLKSSGQKVYVNADIVKIRPYIAFALIKNINMKGNKIKQIMDFQENLHWVLGRDRKKVAIGIHNLDPIEGPYSYIATEKSENSFIPLEHKNKLSPEEILQEHEKGSKYAKLIEEFDKYPLILDKNNQVLSMPPIINGELTKLTEDTENILVDVTGTDEKAVNQTLNIICSSFAEVGGEIETMEIVYPDKTIITPDLTPNEKNVKLNLINSLIGINIDIKEAQRLLSKARMNSTIINDNELKIQIPAYRVDILHPVDLVENIAIQYCIKKIESKLPDVSTVAYENPWFSNDKTMREVMIGLGFQEIMSLMLTSENAHYALMNQKEDDRVEVARPITIDRTMIRKSLINGLMEFLEDNKHEDLPQKIFEIGDVIYIDEEKETKTKTVKKLAGAICHSTANFTEIKSTIASIIANLDYKMEILESNNSSFIPGRVANIKGTSESGNITGFFGEISPEVITNFELEYPVIAFEIEFL